MKAKKWLTIITLVVTLVAMIVALYAKCNKYDLAYDFSMAIFGSALLGFIMSLTEYFTERRKAMEDFLRASYKVYSKLRKIKYIDTDEPRDLIIDCIAEEQRNAYCCGLEGETAKAMGMIVDHTKRDEYIEWMEANEAMSFSEEDDIQGILIQTYNQRIEDYKKLFMSRIDMYLETSKIDFEDLANAYGNLDFLFGNKTIRQKAYNSIYQKLQDWRNKLLIESYHFGLLKEGKGNFAISVRKLFELNDMFFEAKSEHTTSEIHTVVYQRLFDDMADRIEEFRCSTYFKKNVTYEKKTPVLSKIKRSTATAQNTEV